MNFKALDDPALVLPRVMDVYGTFQRLGFEWRVYKGVEFAQANVQLLYPVEARLTRRAISHVGFLIYITGSDVCQKLEVKMRYGYPTKVQRGTRVVHDFKELATADGTYWTFGDDRWLRNVEHLFKALFEKLRTKMIDRLVTDDDGNERYLPGYEALSYAVTQALAERPWRHSKRREETSDWFIDAEPVKQEPEVIPVNKYSRLPNFDRSTRPRHRTCLHRRLS